MRFVFRVAEDAVSAPRARIRAACRGGEGLSGTGPKAGGPRYLHRFAVERVVSTDTTAAGGNAALMALGDVT